jgi:hypothetical protein
MEATSLAVTMLSVVPTDLDDAGQALALRGNVLDRAHDVLSARGPSRVTLALHHLPVHGARVELALVHTALMVVSLAVRDLDSLGLRTVPVDVTSLPCEELLLVVHVAWLNLALLGRRALGLCKLLATHLVSGLLYLNVADEAHFRLFGVAMRRHHGGLLGLQELLVLGPASNVLLFYTQSEAVAVAALSASYVQRVRV